jgi:hypothetical protein
MSEVKPHERVARSSGALEALVADGPHAQSADEQMLFGQLVGAWEFDGVEHDAEGGSRELSGEWHFDWVLEGRAIQDVLVSPARKDRVGGQPAYVYGTTIRFFDPRIEVWRVAWVDPVNGNLRVLTAKRVAEEIVMEGTTNEGLPMRWIWSELSATSAHWRSVVSSDEGATWQLREEMRLRRVPD